MAGWLGRLVDLREADVNPVQADNDRAKTTALATNIQLVAGGAILAAGIIWKLVDRPSKRPSKSRDTAMRTHVGPGGIGIAGSW